MSATESGENGNGLGVKTSLFTVSATGRWTVVCIVVGTLLGGAGYGLIFLTKDILRHAASVQMQNNNRILEKLDDIAISNDFHHGRQTQALLVQICINTFEPAKRAFFRSADSFRAMEHDCPWLANSREQLDQFMELLRQKDKTSPYNGLGGAH